MPTVSIVIPAFNRERFIAIAIESALGQTVPADEIIVVDDGSTDRTGEIARSYGPPVRVISIENNSAGPSRPRNVGIQAAASSHIMFLDSDDLLEPTIVARHRDVLTRTSHVGLVCSNYWIASSREGSLVEKRRNEAQTIRELAAKTRIAPGEYLVRSADAYQTYCGANFIRFAATVPKAVCERVGGFDETLRTANDFDFMFRVLAHHDMVYIDEPLHTYVHHLENISAANVDRKFRDFVVLNYLRVLRRELKRSNEPRCQTAIRTNIQDCLLSLAYGYRSTGHPIRSLRRYAEYVYHRGEVWAGVRGAAGTLLQPFRTPNARRPERSD